MLPTAWGFFIKENIEVVTGGVEWYNDFDVNVSIIRGSNK